MKLEALALRRPRYVGTRFRAMTLTTRNTRQSTSMLI